MKISQERSDNIKTFRKRVECDVDRMDRAYPSVYTVININYYKDVIFALDYAIKKLKKKVVYPKLAEPTSASDMVKKKYVHKSEFQTILSGNIDGVDICSDKIPCNKKTKLPNGMKADTNTSNITNYAGGWNCGHAFYAVAKEAVPKNIRDKFK